MSELNKEQRLMIYDALIETLIESGADNYLSLTLSREDDPQEYEILIRRAEGLTDAEKNFKLEQQIAELEKKLEIFDTYNPMHSAPMDGTEIIGLYEDGEAQIFWSEKPVCILGSRNGTFSAGWATCGGDIDYNLPMSEPLAWSDV